MSRDWSPEDIDVLIDMLDEPLRREFAAHELGSQGSVVGMTHEQVCRAADIAKLEPPTPRSSVRASWVRPALHDLACHFYSDRMDKVRSDVVRQVYFIRQDPFDTREEAEAYAEFVTWRNSKEWR